MVKQLEARKASIAAAEAEADAEAEAALVSNADKATPASGTPAADFNSLAR
jgi:hypothetical protein